MKEGHAQIGRRRREREENKQQLGREAQLLPALSVSQRGDPARIVDQPVRSEPLQHGLGLGLRVVLGRGAGVDAGEQIGEGQGTGSRRSQLGTQKRAQCLGPEWKE